MCPCRHLHLHLPPTNILQAGAFAPFGPTVLASNIVNSNDKGLASATRLTGGGSVVAWSTGTAVLVQRLAADGQPVGAAQNVGAVLTNEFDVSTRLSAVATADGGWLIAWIAPDHSVLFRRYDASGAPLAAAAPVDATAFSKVLCIQARGLADGGFVVAWVAATGTGPTRALVRRFSAAAAAVTDSLAPTDNPGAQSAVQIVPMPDGSFLSAWVQANPDGTDSLFARRLDAGLKADGAEQVLQPAAQFHPYSFLAGTSLSGGVALFAWAYYDGANLQVRWQVPDALGRPTIPSSSPSSAAMPRSRIIDSVEAVPAANGFRVVAESTLYPAGGGSNTAYTTVLEIGPAGEPLGNTETSRVLTSVSQTTGAGCSGPRNPGVAAGGGEDGHYLLAYATCGRRDSGSQPWPPSNVEALGR